MFCEVNAATPIKSYSPELIVHPVLKLCGYVTDSVDYYVFLQCSCTNRRSCLSEAPEDVDETLEEQSRTILASMDLWLPRLSALLLRCEAVSEAAT